MLREYVGAETIRLAVLGLLVVGLGSAVALVLAPFVVSMLWAGILAFATWPLYVRLLRLCGARAWPSAFGMTLLVAALVVVPTVWLLYLLDYNLSLAVWVGMIALAGLDAETGLVMLLYLDNSFDRFKAEGRMRNTDDLWWAVHDGAVKRIRPKTMTVMTDVVALVPVLWATGAGADTMRRLAAPIIGGLATSFIMELLLYPVIFYLIKRRSLVGVQSTSAA